MSGSFKEALKARLYQNKTHYPLLELDDLFDSPIIGDQLDLARAPSRVDHRGHMGCPFEPTVGYFLISMTLNGPTIERFVAIGSGS